MADTSTSIETVFERVLRLLREDALLRAYIHNFHDGRRVTPTISEMPVLLLIIDGASETPLTDWPYVVATDIKLRIRCVDEIYDEQAAQWRGADSGKGAWRMEQDVKTAIQGDTNLNDSCEWLNFDESTPFEDYPRRGVDVVMTIRIRQNQEDRMETNL